MELNVQAHGETLIIAPAAGPMTLKAANDDDFRAAAQDAIGQACQVVLDMRLVESVDSSGLSALVALARDLYRRGGELRLAELQRNVWAVFEVARLHRVFEIHDTPVDAVESFNADVNWD